MINGYEELYQGEQPKYKRLFENDLVHSVAPSGRKGPIDLTGNEAMASIMEQEIGQENYRKLLSFERDYLNCVNSLRKYQNDKSLYDQKESELATLKNKNKVLEYKIEFASKNLSNLNNDELEELKNDITQLQEVKNKISEIQVEMKPVNREAVIKDLNTLASGFKDIMQEDLLNGVQKFEDSKFRNKVEQVYVDTMLLPGEDKLEKSVRACANARYDMYSLEMDHLKMSIENAEELMNFVKNKGVDSSLSLDIVNKAEMVKAIKQASTEEIDSNSILVTESEQHAKYYSYITEHLKETNFEQEDNTNVNLYKDGIVKFGIPQHEEYNLKGKVSHAVSKLSGKVKSNYGMGDMGAFNNTLSAIDKMYAIRQKFKLQTEEFNR